MFGRGGVSVRGKAVFGCCVVSCQSVQSEHYVQGGGLEREVSRFLWLYVKCWRRQECSGRVVVLLDPCCCRLLSFVLVFVVIVVARLDVPHGQTFCEPCRRKGVEQ